MVLQKRLDYGFIGYQAPPVPRAARSARRRSSPRKKLEDNQMCAFELLATVAGKLLLEGKSFPSSADKCSAEECAAEKQTFEDLINVKPCDQESFSGNSIMPGIVLQNADHVQKHNPQFASGATSSDLSKKVLSKENSLVGGSTLSKGDVGSTGNRAPVSCKSEEQKIKPIKIEPPNPVPAFIGSNNSAKLPVCHGRRPCGSSFLVCEDDVKLVVRDDDDNSSGCIQHRTLGKAFRPLPRNGDRRIWRFIASKYWKVPPKVKDGVNFRSNAELKHVYHSRKNVNKHQRSLRDYPFKKRRLYGLNTISNSDEGLGSDSRSSSPMNGSNKDCAGLGAKSQGGIRTSVFTTGQQAAFQARDSHVKLKIKSFRIPELFIEIPETSTVGSLKRMVMEAVNAILSGEVRVGMVLQGKKIRDDNKTLLQTGICHNDKLDALGFTLEPTPSQSPSPFCPDDFSFLQPTDMPRALTRHPNPPSLVNQIEHGTSNTSPDPKMTNVGNLMESDHDSAPSPHGIMTDKRVTNSKALVTVPDMEAEALAVVPMRKPKRVEAVQRRIRRPFSVSEVESLVQAVEKLGTRRWRDVKLRAFDNAKHRTYVDLKDKWKTLVHTARISPQQRRGEPVPQELLDRVLAAHAYWSHHQAKQQLKQPPQTCLLL